MKQYQIVLMLMGVQRGEITPKLAAIHISRALNAAYARGAGHHEVAEELSQPEIDLSGVGGTSRWPF